MEMILIKSLDEKIKRRDDERMDARSETDESGARILTSGLSFDYIVAPTSLEG